MDFQRLSQQSMHEGGDGLEHRPGQQQQSGHALPALQVRMARRQHQHQQGAQHNGAGVQRQAPAPMAVALQGFLRGNAQRLFELGTAGADQVKARRALGRRGGQAGGDGLRGGHDRLGHLALCLAVLPGQPLHRLGDVLARQLAFLAKAGQLAQHLQAVADRLDQLNPVHLANQAQRGDDVADGQVGSHLGILAFEHQRMAVRAVLLGPQRQCRRRRAGAQFGRHALPQLGQVVALQAVPGHQRIDGVQVSRAERLHTVPDRMGNFAGHFAQSNLVGHAAQVFQQHDAQRGRQGPQLAQAQLAAALVSVEKSGEYLRVQRAVGVRHVGPSNAIDARQALQRRPRQFGQAGVIAARHALADLLQLGFDQRKVVQQPLGGRRGVMTAQRGQRNVIVGLAQRGQIFLDAGKKRRVVA